MSRESKEPEWLRNIPDIAPPLPSLQVLDYPETGALLSSLCPALRHLALAIATVGIVYIYIYISYSPQAFDCPNTGAVLSGLRTAEVTCG